jgi:hypothetical protein
MGNMEILNFSSDRSKLDTSNLIPHSIWDIESVTARSIFNSDRFFAYGSHGLQMEDTSFDITMVRRPLYFMMNNVFPP